MVPVLEPARPPTLPPVPVTLPMASDRVTVPVLAPIRPPTLPPAPVTLPVTWVRVMVPALLPTRTPTEPLPLRLAPVRVRSLTVPPLPIVANRPMLSVSGALIVRLEMVLPSPMKVPVKVWATSELV